MFAPRVAKPKLDAPSHEPLHRMLRLGPANDPLEREADRVADHVMGMPGPAPAIMTAPLQINRRCAACQEETIKRKESGPDPAMGEVPHIVHRALEGAGQPLDPAARAFFEPRFGFDFGRVRIHVDAEAAEAAAAIHSRAYTVGTDVVFARGAYAPATDGGRRLIAHELAHVTQQTGGSPRGVGAGRETGALPTKGALQRQPDPNQSPQTVDPAGKLSPGKTEAAKAPGVWRIPIQGLRKDPAAWAVALIPNMHAPTVQDVDVDVLLHFHGYGAGYRMLKEKESDFAGVLKPGQLRDVDLYEMEQQLLSLVQKSKKSVIAVLPQGSDRSDFGGLSKDSAGYLKEVFARLIADGHLPKGTSPGNVTVSGHSGGGVAATAAATERVAKGGRQDLLLFDAINFACAEKVQEEIKGEKQVNKDGTPKMVCKRCTSNEYTSASKWVTERIQADAKLQITAKNLKEFGTRFRGFTHAPVDAKVGSCSYGHWYFLLKQDIDKAIADLKTSAHVEAQLHENFQVKSVPGAHEDVMAHGSLEAALGG